MRIVILALFSAFVAGGAFANCGDGNCNVGAAQGEGGHTDLDRYSYFNSGTRDAFFNENPGAGFTTATASNLGTYTTMGLVRDDGTLSGRTTSSDGGGDSVCTGQCEDSGYPLP